MGTARRRSTRAVTPWAVRTLTDGRKLTDAEIERLRGELQAAHAEGLARLARAARAKILADADREAWADDEDSEAV